MRRRNGKVGAIVWLIMLILCVILFVSPGCAQEPKGEKANGPERSFSMNFAYPEIIFLGGTGSVDLDLTFKKRGKKEETIIFRLPVPSGWRAREKTYS